MTGLTRVNEDNIFSWLVAGSLLVSVAMGILLALAASLKFGVSFFAGGALATANFFWLRRGLETALSLQAANASRYATLRYLLRLAVMAFLLYLLIVRLGANIFGLLLGLSVLVLNIIAFSIYFSTRKGG